MTTVSLDPITGHPIFLIELRKRHPLSEAVRAGVYPVCPDAFRVLVDAEDQVAALIEQLQQPRESLLDYERRVVVGMVDGKPLPEDFRAAARAILEDEEHRNLELGAVGRVQDLLTQHWANAATEHADEVLGGLRAELDQVLRETRKAAQALGELDPIDAEAVAGASPEQRSAIVALKELRPRYRHIRSLQREFLKAVRARPWYSADPRDPNRWAWGALWATRVHEFRGADLNGAFDPDRSPTWYRPLIDRKDVWLPPLAELEEAWSGIRSLVSTSSATEREGA